MVEALPFLLREDRARDVQITYELRLTGKGGGGQPSVEFRRRGGEIYVKQGQEA